MCRSWSWNLPHLPVVGSAGAVCSARTLRGVTSHRNRRPPPLPGAAAALAAAGAGRWRLEGGRLHLDAAARRLLGTSAARFALAPWLQRLLPADAQALQAALAGPAAQFSLAIDSPAGRVQLRGSRRTGHWLGLVLPATGQEPAEASYRVREAFFASVSHELRTPLHAVLGFTRLAQQAAAGTPAQRHLLPIAQSAGMMLRVVNDLLDLASLEAGRLEIDPDQLFEPLALALRLGSLAAGLRQDKPVRIYTTVDPACPARLRGDAGRIAQVLLNLLANALKFTPRGTVVLAFRLRAHHGDRVTLRAAVSDTGLGIAPDALPRIGEAFERATDPHRPRADGSGLGLAVVRRLLQLHGTRLQMASVPGGGTTCWFDLDLLLDSQPEPPPAPADTAAFSADRRLLATLATQWRAHGRALLPAAAAGQAACWVVDTAAADATDRIAQGRQAGRRLLLVSAEPVAEGSGVHPLPLLPAAAFEPAAAPAGPALPSLDGLHVLLVEDNPLAQRMVVALLEPLGARTVVADDGRQALAQFSRQHVDVALLDLDLPDQRGLDLARSLRARPGGARLPLVVLSAHIDAADRLAAQGLGVMACLDKPVDADRLLQLLAALPRAGADSAPAPPADPPPRTTAPQPDLAALFSQQWPALEAAITGAADAAALRRAVHALRGSLAFVGDAALRQLARTVETGLANGQPAAGLPLAALLQHSRALAAR